MLLTLLKDYRYYGSPEGKDPVGKVVGVAKYGFVGSHFAGLYDAMILSKTTTLPTTLNCFAYWVIPITSMSIVFPTVVYMATNIRGKDDPFNYALGALALGPILHVWQKANPYATCWITGVAALIAAIQKDHLLKGFDPLPTQRRSQRRFK